MATPGSNAVGKKDRREEAREKARLARESEKKRKRRNRIFLQGGIGVAVLAIAAIIVLVIVNAPPAPSLSKAKSGPNNMISNGIILSGKDLAAVRTGAVKSGSKPTPTDPSKYPDTTNIVTYIDYQCPACQAFEATNGDQISQWVQSGEATIEIHPIAILDNSSQGNMYSTRAASAAACVANYDPDKYYDMTMAMYVNQPAEGTNGLPDSGIESILKNAGVSSPQITKCIETQRYVNWVTAATALTTKPLPNSTISALQHTPTVIVNGHEFTGSITDASAFAKFVQSGGTSN